jgi:hypothetical protein
MIGLVGFDDKMIGLVGLNLGRHVELGGIGLCENAVVGVLDGGGGKTDFW